MPQFNPGEEKVALATFPVAPAELECAAELWLASNGAKVATSGEIPFISTGADQAISLPITMPSVEGTYPVYLDVSSGGVLIKSFRAVEDVVIVPLGLIGDLNDDGIIDMADYDILMLYILGRPISEISPLPEAEFLRRADVNGDGAINVLDLTALSKMLPKATLTQVELEYDGVQATIPLADVPQGKTARMHIWGRNDMSTDQKLGIAWIIDDPDIEMAQVYSEWEPEYTSPGEEHEFIGPEFNLGKLGVYTIAVVSLYIYPEGTWPVDSIPPAPTICTVVIAPAVPGNLLLNPGFEDAFEHWTAYTNYPGRAHWVPSDEQPYEGLKSAAFAASVGGRPVVCTLSQVVPWNDGYKGQTFQLSAMRGSYPAAGAHDIEGMLTFYIYDGVTYAQNAVYVSHGEAYREQSVVVTLSPNANRLEVIFQIVPPGDFHGSAIYLDKAILEKV